MNKLLFLISIFILVPKSYGDDCGLSTGGVVIQQISKTRMKTSSGLIYNADHQLYWVERDSPALWVITGRTSFPRRYPIIGVRRVLAAIPTQNDPNKFIALADNKMFSLNVTRQANLNFKSITKELIKTVEPNGNMEFTYCKVDKKSRLYIDEATKTPIKKPNTIGKLLQVTNETINNVLGLHDMKHPQGIGFTSNFKSIFLADSNANVIWMYKYDIENGTIDEGKIVFNLTSERYYKGYVCSLTVSKTGLLWIGICETGTIILYDWEKKQLQQIHKIPAKYPTWLEMGDPDLATLFVATDMSFNKVNPERGHVFALTGTGVKGQPSHFLNY